jgi:tetratricopeptide (TPR) repeat protein
VARERPAPRTLLEQLIREMDATYEELSAQYNKLAQRLSENTAMSVRHLQRLAYGERPGQRTVPSTGRVMRQLFGFPMTELLGPPRMRPATQVEDVGSLVGSAANGGGSGRPAPSGELVERIRIATSVDHALVQALHDQTDYLRVMDRRLAGLILRQQLLGHLATLRSLLEHAICADQRAPLSAELSDAEALAAWVALDLGDIEAAWAHHHAARLAAREAESLPLLAHAMMQQAFVLTEIDEVKSAVQLAREATTLAGTSVPPLLVAWLRAGEGEVLAVAGDDRGSRTAFDQALGALPGDARDPDLPYIQLDQSHLARWHGNVLARLGDAAAVDRLFEALNAPDHSLRAQAGLHTDLAVSLTTTGDRNQARGHLQQARDLAVRAGSRRQLRRIVQLSAKRQDM